MAKVLQYLQKKSCKDRQSFLHRKKVSAYKFCLLNIILEEQEELMRQREQEEKNLAEKQAVRRYERANVRENIRDKYKLTKGS